MRYTLRQRLIALPGGSESGTATSDSPDRPARPVRGVAGPTPLHIVRRWDSDARLAAWEQAQTASDRDPDAAAHLLACLSADSVHQADAPQVEQVEQVEPDTSRFSRRKPFDLMRLIAHVAKYYAFSDHDIMRLPWKRFLAYAREAEIMTEEENQRMQDEMARTRANYDTSGARGTSRDTNLADVPGYGGYAYPDEYTAS